MFSFEASYSWLLFFNKVCLLNNMYNIKTFNTHTLTLIDLHNSPSSEQFFWFWKRKCFTEIYSYQKWAPSCVVGKCLVEWCSICLVQHFVAATGLNLASGSCISPPHPPLFSTDWSLWQVPGSVGEEADHRIIGGRHRLLNIPAMGHKSIYC